MFAVKAGTYASEAPFRGSTTLGIMALVITTFSINDTEHNNALPLS
jgi:hypothetical protein